MADLKELARRIFHDTITAIDICATMQRKLWREGPLLHVGLDTVDMSAFARVLVVAIGKAAHAMLDGLEAVLPAGMDVEGVVSAPAPPHRPMRGVRYFVGGHPIPNAESRQAAENILALLKTADEYTLVFFLLSGGGSALVELPLDPEQTPADTERLYRALVTCGGSIDEINTVRKHLSAVKGGRLAEAAGKATKVTVAVTDVPAGKESALASGPTLPDPTTVAHVQRVFAKYELDKKVHSRLAGWIRDGKIAETPKENHPAFANAHFMLLLGMDDLFHAAHHSSEAKGCAACCDNTTDDWPVDLAVDFLLEQLDEWAKANPGERVAVIADGEVSSPVTGQGIGGRNSAFVLACVKKIAGRRVTVLSGGTDGVDGNSPAAGAVADGETLARAALVGLDPEEAFARSDAFTFFAKLDDVISTGPTGNNLRDLRILISDEGKHEDRR